MSIQKNDQVELSIRIYYIDMTVLKIIMMKNIKTYILVHFTFYIIVLF